MKINGFVELDSKWVEEETDKYLARIKQWRIQDRQAALEKFKKKYNERTSFFSKKKPELVDDNVAEEIMDKEGAKGNMFYIPLSHWVAHSYSDIYSEMNELNSACKLTDKILVNTNLAGILQRWKGKE
jgi:hypothetical protein